MNKRTFVKTLFLGIPAIKPDSKAYCEPLHIGHLMHLMEGFRIEMGIAQHKSFNELKVICGCPELTNPNNNTGFTAGMLHALPVTLNVTVPKDEIWLVGYDGTVISKLTNLAIPYGYE